MATTKKKTAKKKKAAAPKDPKAKKKKSAKKISAEKLVEMAGEATGATAAIASPLTQNLPRGTNLHRAINNFMASQNKKAGHRVMAFASDVPNTYELRRPSGVMQLDLDTGGGLPAGGLSYISGPDNAGKSFLMLCYMVMHQRLYGDASSLAYACAEGGFDFKRAINIGLKVRVPDEIKWEWSDERMQLGHPAICDRPRVVGYEEKKSGKEVVLEPVIQPYPCTYTDEDWDYFNQEVGKFIILGGLTGEQILQSVLAAVKERLFGIICVDSVSVLLPTADADKDLEDFNKVGAQASMVTDFIKHYTPMTSGLGGVNHTTLIFSSQVRANTERAHAPMRQQKYIKQWKPTGAYSARHGKLIDIHIWGGEKLRKQVQGEQVTVGKVTKYEIAKGKAGAHDGVTGEFPFYYDFVTPEGVDRLDTVIIEGLRRGVLTESTAGTVDVVSPTSGKNHDLGGVPGMNNFKKLMEISLDYELAIRHQILSSKGIMCLYR